MNASRGYLRYFALFSILALCFIGQVTARKCYECSSAKLSDCTFGNLTEAYQVECGKTSGKPEKDPIEYDCVYVKGITLEKGTVVVTRSCMPKFITCDTVKVVSLIQVNGVQLETCKRCDSDNCNSSAYMKAGFWILSLSLLMSYLYKF